MAITLEKVKNYLRIDTDHEDTLLEQFMAAAESYLVAAVDGYSDKLSDAAFESKSDMVLLAIIAEMYSNRDASNDRRDTFPFYISSQITQLQYWQEVEQETPAEPEEPAIDPAPENPDEPGEPVNPDEPVDTEGGEP